MVAPDFNENDRKAIEAAYKAKAGDELHFDVQIVKEIPLTARGKLKLLDSKLNPPLPISALSRFG